MAEYLAIKNWAKFQSLRRSGKWIKDYTAQGDEPELARLTMFQRGVLQELRRIRGRLGKNIPFDFDFIARAMHALPTDCPHIGHAIDTMVSLELLILTNQQYESVNSSESKKEKEKEIENKPSASAKPRGQLKPTDPRFQHCVEILHRYWDKFVNGKVRFEVWMDKAGYKQLQNSLKRSEALTVEDFTMCVANRARSPGVSHCEPAYKWLGHVTEWAGGPEVNGAGTSKAEQRNADISETTRAVFSEALGVLRDAPKSLPLKTPT